MNDGEFTYYTLQHRRTHESPWLKPNEPLVAVQEDKDWCFSSWDVFGGTAEPWHGSGNNWKPKHKKAHDETHSVRANTGSHGWWSLKYAAKGLKRIKKSDAEGKFDSRGPYNEHCAAVRHEFRLVKVVVSKSTNVVTAENFVEELAGV